MVIFIKSLGSACPWVQGFSLGEIMREALTFNKQLITFHMRFQTPQLLLLYELLKFPFHNSTQHPQQKYKCVPTLLHALFQYQDLNYSAQAFLGSEHSLAKCPTSLQHKQMTSDKSRGFLVAILVHWVLGFLAGHLLA